MKAIYKLFTIFTPRQLRSCVFIVFAMIIGAFLEAIGIGAILPLLSVMGQPDFLEMHPAIARWAVLAGVTDHTGFIILCAIGLIVLYLIKNAYIAWENKLQIDFSMKNQIYYSEQLMVNYLRKPYLFHLNHNTATLLRNVNSAGNAIFIGMLVPAFSLLTEVATAFAIWLMLVFVDAFTAIIVAGLLAGMLYGIIKMFRRRISRLGKIQNDCSAQYIKWVNQGLGSIKETKVLCRESFFFNEFKKTYWQYGQANRHFVFMNQLPRLMIETVVVSGLLFLIVVKLMLGALPMKIVPLLGVLALAAFRLMPSANRIVNLSNQIRYQVPFFLELYDEFMEIKQRQLQGKQDFDSNPKAKILFQNEVSVEHLNFRYAEDGPPVFKDLCFSIPKGQFVGIIGSSGAGKTTFVDTLLGLLKPSQGAILVDGIDIHSDISAWRAGLAYVPQTIYLMDGTIRENIAFGIASERIDDVQVVKALQMAELYDFVMSLSNGLDTQVGERGVRLSGGQRQRIGIARALYCRPDVLILDEATSALDNETEKSITDTILKLKGQITIIAIAHRVSTLVDCDFKIRFENGTATVLK